MAKLPTYEELGDKVAEYALDNLIYYGLTLREWIQLIIEKGEEIQMEEKKASYSIYYLHQPSGKYHDTRVDAIGLSEKIRQLQNEGCLIISVYYLKGT
jgi:hypothetical protein